MRLMQSLCQLIECSTSARRYHGNGVSSSYAISVSKVQCAFPSPRPFPGLVIVLSFLPQQRREQQLSAHDNHPVLGKPIPLRLNEHWLCMNLPVSPLSSLSTFFFAGAGHKHQHFASHPNVFRGLRLPNRYLPL